MLRSLIALIAGLLLLPLAAFAMLPSPTYGWNYGNTLEPPDGEGAWGPAANQDLVNAVADAGFNTIRLPVAWDSHADQSTYRIDAAWMARVKQVVDWCYARDLHVILNIHWDKGWLENKLTDTVDPVIDAKMRSYWTQIATAFRDYDHRLIFAGANEPDCVTAAKWATLMTYYETFIDAVRATGGNNSSRWLVIQGPKTNMDLSYELVTAMPRDPTPDRLAFEVHYYEPYPWALMNEDASWGKRFYFWGRGYHHPTRTDRNASWGEEDYVDEKLQKMADKFVAKGIPVILGEFQAFKRNKLPDLTGADFALHVASRTYFHKYVVDGCNARGIKPIYWDQAGQMFDWSTGALIDRDNLRALTGGPALPRPDACAGTSVAVASIMVGVADLGQGKQAGRATVTVVNNCGDPIAGATVTGGFIGTLNQSGMSAVTDPAGVARFQTGAATKGKVNVKFCVSGVAKDGLTYDASANVATCGKN